MIGKRTSKRLKLDKNNCRTKNKFICERPRKDTSATVNYKAFKKSNMKQALQKCAAWKGKLLSVSDDMPFKWLNDYWLDMGMSTTICTTEKK